MRFPKKEYSDIIKAIRPEIGQVAGRSTEKVEEDGDYFYVYIEAPDTVSFEASLGNFTRLITMIQRLNSEVR